MRNSFLLAIRDEIDLGPNKTITIRGLNKKLYDDFINLVTIFGVNTGSIFSYVISTYNKKFNPFFLPYGYRSVGFRNHSKHEFEVIENLDFLKVSKDDLISAGEDVKYIFKDIKKLVFDETVDNKIFLSHVYRIRRSNIETKGNISKLFLASTDNENIKLPIIGEAKDVTIRNVSESSYDEFLTYCQMHKITVGDYVNEILSRTIPSMELMHIITRDPSLIGSVVVSMKENLIVSQKDLEEMEGRKLLFHRINNLTFSKDVEKEQFINLVLGIYNSENVNLPTSIPKLISLSRVRSFPPSN